MKCPHCNKDLKVANLAYLTAGMHNANVATVTECCNKPVKIIPYTHFEVQIYEGEEIKQLIKP